MVSIVLVNNTFRLKDNKALFYACQSQEIIPIFVWDEQLYVFQGKMSKLALCTALTCFDKSLSNKLIYLKGDLVDSIIRFIDKLPDNVEKLYFNSIFEPVFREKIGHLKTKLYDKNIIFEEYNSQLLYHPETVLKNDGSYYKIYTPFYNQCMNNSELVDAPLPKPKKIRLYKYTNNNFKLQSFLKEISPDYKQDSSLNLSEAEAEKKLKYFIKNKLKNYETQRDFISNEGTSMLSAFIHFGIISVNEIYDLVMSAKNVSEQNKISFIRELIFRDFSYYLLYHFPMLPYKNFDSKYDLLKWSGNKHYLLAWQRGKTGIPIIDAGIRELNKTGYMHNRVRMLVGCFLTKNLLIDWKHGRKWFEDNLIDADLAINSFSWQWVAGTGVDNSPYFRVFNPVTQAKKFDPKAEYIKKFVPELKKVPLKYIFEPHLMPEKEAKKINFKIGADYPNPIVDLSTSRKMAIQEYKSVQKKSPTEE